MILKKFYKISMKKNALKCIVLLGLLWCGPLFLKAQEEALEDSSWKKEYRAFATKENDLVHTKLVARFDYSKSQLNGEAWLTLHPHFYATNQLILDAKGMDIFNVSMVPADKNLSNTISINKPLKYTYDGMLLKIELDKKYTANQNYTVYIKYTAKPNDYKAKGSVAITDAKGLYFINPLGTDKNKPTQIWTQGETEGTSVWLPIIDKPNQKCTQEFQLYVPQKYVSLSNGLLVKQVPQKDGTRLDIWKMDQVHAPYLFFIGIGDYAIVKQEAQIANGKKKIELSYYIEKEFEKEALKIYGKTPQMMALYEKLLGIPFPWVKYAQISGRDYVSGAMENTTCTLHGDAVQQDARELVDGNNWESTIAHELFHQWFGDLVTAESWSNLTVNESFADYSQTIWLENSKGKDAGDYENYTGLRNYLSSPNDAEKNLVRFYYKDREDMFDLVSYQKGGRILHMLRHFVGDEAFYAALHKYLTDHSYTNGSAIKLKLAFESVTGRDLNWFFNQWYFNNSHPYINITQQYDATKKEVMVKLQQTQLKDQIFELPIGIDVYVDGQRNHYEVWNKNRVDSFYFPASKAPDNINVDNDKILLWEKNDSKPLSQYIYQYYHARNFMDRYEAVQEAAQNLKNVAAQKLMADAMKDTFYVIRAKAINSFNPANLNDDVEKIIANVASKDPSNIVREEAINTLGALKKEIYKNQFMSWTKDSSYSIAGAALEALDGVDSLASKKIAIEASKKVIKKRLNSAVTSILTKYGDESVFDFIADKYEAFNNQSNDKFYMTAPFAELLIKTNDAVKFKRGIDLIVAFRESIPTGYRGQTDPYFNVKIFGDILKAKKQKGQQNLVDIVTSQLPKL
ncbi:MAG: M1 family peptidase [Chitinophagia bacterium]|nr:M1 family peptidase [Chitinophagia bacterium]